MAAPPAQVRIVRSVTTEPPLLRYEENVVSQSGEDGVIAYALASLPNRDRWCVEFGAADGRYISNTYRLIAEERYSAVLIESDPEKFKALARRYEERSEVITLRRVVHFEGPDRLDAILAGTRVPRDFDLLSIDIDGNDYHVWDAFTEYRPKLVVVEYNPTIPNELDFVQPRNMRMRQGSSLAAIRRLAHTKGYRMIHATVANGIFVDEKYFSAFGIEDDSTVALRSDLSLITWFFHTYDGQIHLAGNPRVSGHGVPLREDRFQVVPRQVRKFPGDFSRAERLAWWGWRATKDPRAALLRLRKLLSA